MKWPTKSRRLRRVFQRTPGGRTVIHLKPFRKGKTHCASCKTALNAVISNRDAKFKSKSQKRPTRVYGGYLCHKCTTRVLIDKTRKQL